MGEVAVLSAHHEVSWEFALAADAYAQPQPYGLAELAPLPELGGPPEICGCNADAVPWLGAVREQARAGAVRIVAERQQHLRDGEFDRVPLDVDALGTAAKLAAVGDTFGKASAEYADARAGLVLDCSRKWAEAFRKNTWEYFGVSTQQYDAESDMLFANGFSVDEMIYNGLSPLGEREETERRINDAVNLAGQKALLKNPQATGLALLHVSPCTDWAHCSYRGRPMAAHGGYAPEIDKLMVNFDLPDHASGTIYHEQVGVSGRYITPGIVAEAFSIMGIIEPGQPLGRTDIHATQGVVATELASSVFDFLRIADELASQRSGQEIFMGEVVAPTHPKDYTSVIAEATQRRDEQARLSEELTCYVEELHASDTDHALATVLVDKFVQDKLLAKAATDPELAEQVFNKATAERFHHAQLLESQGRQAEAEAEREQARQNAPAASSCGAGSCGLESVSKAEQDKVKDLFGAKGDGEVIKDTERACPLCHQKKLYYYDVKRNGSGDIISFQKGCRGCEKTDAKGATKQSAKSASESPSSTFTFFSSSENRGRTIELAQPIEPKLHAKQPVSS